MKTLRTYRERPIGQAAPLPEWPISAVRIGFGLIWLVDAAFKFSPDFRTGNVEAMSDGVLATDEENWTAIRAETTRLNRLVNDLQRVSRAEAHQLDLHRTPTEVSTLVEDAIKAATPAYAAKGVTLSADLPPPPPIVDVDAERIGEVLANLLANSLRHTHPGGDVRVSAHPQGQFGEIAIKDTGEGIAAEHLGRIFERFYRVDPARSRASGGTGIGLAIVRAIVEAHGGTVTASSDGPGRGATLTVQLPVRRAENASHGGFGQAV